MEREFAEKQLAWLGMVTLMAKVMRSYHGSIHIGQGRIDKSAADCREGLCGEVKEVLGDNWLHREAKT